VNANTRHACFVVATLGLSGLGVAARTTEPVTHTVTIDSVQFQPDVLTVKVGEPIVWVNKDPFPHTVTSESKNFDSHEIQPGKSWKYTPAKAGEFPYVCLLHPTMKGTLRVK